MHLNLTKILAHQRDNYTPPPATDPSIFPPLPLLPDSGCCWYSEGECDNVLFRLCVCVCVCVCKCVCEREGERERKREECGRV